MRLRIEAIVSWPYSLFCAAARPSYDESRFFDLLDTEASIESLCLEKKASFFVPPLESFDAIDELWRIDIRPEPSAGAVCRPRLPDLFDANFSAVLFMELPETNLSAVCCMGFLPVLLSTATASARVRFDFELWRRAFLTYPCGLWYEPD